MLMQRYVNQTNPFWEYQYKTTNGWSAWNKGGHTVGNRRKIPLASRRYAKLRRAVRVIQGKYRNSSLFEPSSAWGHIIRAGIFVDPALGEAFWI